MVKKLRTINGTLSVTPWRRFRKNTTAMAGLFLVILAFLIATFCYVLMPDNSPMANRQCLPVCNQPAGFSVHMLKVTENKVSEFRGFFSRTFYGHTGDDIQIPITSYRFDGTDVIVKEFSPAGDSGIESRFNVADVVYPINTKKKIIERYGGLFFETMDGESAEESVSDMQKFIEGQYIINKKYILGTDRYGRDFLSRLIAGTRISIYTGLAAVAVSIFIGLILGLLSGLPGSRARGFISWLMKSVWSFPTLFLVITISLITSNVVLAAAMVLWVEPARIVRDELLAMPGDAFTGISRTLGLNKARILFLHFIPNLTGTLLYIATSTFAFSILIESGISFLSINIDPDLPSWGKLIRESYQYIVVPGSAHLTVLPGIAITLLVSAFVFVSRGIRDAIGTQRQVSIV